MVSDNKRDALPNRALEYKIKKKIRKFELISLVQLLVFHGYRPDEICFKSNASICSQASLINDISFKEKPNRSVVVEVNFGLLSAQSPIPSYFLKNIADKGIDAELFADFVGFFDNHLIWNYLLNVYPEANRKIFSDRTKSKLSYIQMMDLKSKDTLTLIFNLIIPELSVRVEKTVLRHKMDTTSVRLGETRLNGESVFGRKTVVPVYGRRIVFYSDEEFTDTGKPWPEEIKHRLNEQIAPILGPVGINMELDLVIRSQKRWMGLQSESYLGYDKIKGGSSQAYRRIQIFQGRLQPPKKDKKKSPSWLTLNG